MVGMCTFSNFLFYRVNQTKEPTLRPKGLGLGANKMANVEKPQKTKEGTELTLKKGGFAKITAGHHKGSYCEVSVFLSIHQSK